MPNDESGTNLNNLRQALAGNLAAFKTAATAKTVPTTNASTPVTNSSTVTTQTKEKSKQTIGKELNFHSPASKQDSTNVAMNDEERRLSLEYNKDQALMENDQSDVKTVVDNLVSSLSKDELSMKHIKNAMNAGVLSMFEDDPCCSDPSDDDDSDYEDIDEVCDSCLGSFFRRY